MVPKLTYEHIHLTLFSKMRVDLAVQVHMSNANFDANFDTSFLYCRY